MEHPYSHPSICPSIPLSAVLRYNPPFAPSLPPFPPLSLCPSFSFVIIFLRAPLSLVGPNNPVSLNWFSTLLQPTFMWPLQLGPSSSSSPSSLVGVVLHRNPISPLAPPHQPSPPCVCPSNSAQSLLCLLGPPSPLFSLPIIIELTFPCCRENYKDKAKDQF